MPKCGFGFLFELLDDYYPAPNAAFFVCDQQGRLIGLGRGSTELTGLDRGAGDRPPGQRGAGLQFESGDDHVATALEWGVRVLNKPVEVNAEGDLPRTPWPTCSPATTTTAGCSSS